MNTHFFFFFVSFFFSCLFFFFCLFFYIIFSFLSLSLSLSLSIYKVTLSTSQTHTDFHHLLPHRRLHRLDTRWRPLVVSDDPRGLFPRQSVFGRIRACVRRNDDRWNVWIAHRWVYERRALPQQTDACRVHLLHLPHGDVRRHVHRLRLQLDLLAHRRRLVSVAKRSEWSHHVHVRDGLCWLCRHRHSRRSARRRAKDRLVAHRVRHGQDRPRRRHDGHQREALQRLGLVALPRFCVLHSGDTRHYQQAARRQTPQRGGKGIDVGELEQRVNVGERRGGRGTRGG